MVTPKGKRKAGVQKKKGIKANVTSNMNSKRRLSRMGKEQRKGKRGIAAAFMTRSKALKTLQITLKDFRRLCILKGIYPRDPKKKVGGADKTYYHIKDISFLHHEPLLEKFRSFKTFMKRIRKAAGMNNFTDARRRDKQKPEYSLDHIVKERYPSFTDALEDFDDCLCLIYLFSMLPGEKKIRSERAVNCGRLVREWQYYIAQSNSLTKIFVSIKGIYYQAVVMGVTVTWLVPHRFPQDLPTDVDFRVMLTFLEFYETFTKFVNYKLFDSLGLRYPPRFIGSKARGGAFIKSLKLRPKKSPAAESAGETEQEAEYASSSDEGSDGEGAQKDKAASSKAMLKTLKGKMDSIVSRDEEAQDNNLEQEIENEMGESLTIPLEEAFKDSEEMQELQKMDATERKEQQRTQLFAGLTFYLERETPLQMLELAIRSFSGEVIWEHDGSSRNNKDGGITHHVMDRPSQAHRHFGREYIQPQWVLDSINTGVCLPVEKYLPGAELPPHLSPFVDDDKEGYVPDYRTELRKIVAGTNGEAVSDGEEGSGSEGEGEDSEEDEEGRYTKELEAEAKGKSASAADGSEDEEDEEDEDEEEAEEAESSEGEEAPSKKPKYNKFESSMKPEEAEEHEMAVNMMNKKAKRLYGRMQHGIDIKAAAVTKLQEKAEAGAAGGKAKSKKGGGGKRKAGK
jgi:pescadillo protein